MPEPSTKNARRTRASVHFWDKTAERVITLGGVLVLGAVLAICIYLAYVVSPLFASGSATQQHQAGVAFQQEPVAVFIDEYLQASATLSDDGVLTTVLLATGEAIDQRSVIPAGRELTSIARLPGLGLAVIGLDDGSLVLADISFQSLLLSSEQVEELSQDPALASSLGELAPGGSVPAPADIVRRLFADAADAPPESAGGLIEAIETDRDIEYRLTTLRIDASEPIPAPLGEGAAIHVAIAQTATGRVLAQIRADGSAMLHRIIERRPLGGGPVRRRFLTRPIELDSIPDALYVLASGHDALAITRDGTALRFAPTEGASVNSPLVLIETARLVPEGRSITASALLTGARTVLVGDDKGQVHAWFVDKDPNATTADHRRLIRSNTYTIGDAPVTSITVSGRDRVFAAAAENDRGRLIHATSAKPIASIDLAHPAAWAISPKGDALVAIDAGATMRTWSIDGAFAGASLKSLFGPILYEDSKDPTSASYVYQSSSASDDAEAKLSLVPLIFGTLKATVFAMLFAAPIAVLGALYTSEFMQPRTRRYVKPTIELLATLPSVVLGFVAAMIVAPYVRDHLLAIILLAVAVPASVWIAATAWRSARPADRAAESGGVRTLGVLAMLAIATLATVLLAPSIERLVFSPTRTDMLLMGGAVEPVEPENIPEWVGSRQALSPSEQRRLACDGFAYQSNLGVVRPIDPAADINHDGVADETDIARFAQLHGARDRAADSDTDGDIDAEDIVHFAQRVQRHAELDEMIRRESLDRAGLIRWLNGEIRSQYPGWAMILVPVFVLIALVIRGRIRRARVQGGATPGGLLGATVSMLIALALAIALALTLASVLSTMCIDPRDSILGPFTQRNTLVVAIVMGVAIIPIIYTISDDALRSVPDSLRLASLGAGATPWQTAVRVVLPVAGSGVFSACMIGLGRAVGETMIVLMATGSTPEMSANIFSGFRTLAANIAMELPEAPKDGTLYRVLFLCGLVLFLITFAINTTAEIIRQRFRKRNAAL